MNAKVFAYFLTININYFLKTLPSFYLMFFYIFHMFFNKYPLYNCSP